VVHPELQEIDTSAEPFRVEEIRVERLLSQDETDVPSFSQKSLL
jgi:hypothetical protein